MKPTTLRIVQGKVPASVWTRAVWRCAEKRWTAWSTTTLDAPNTSLSGTSAILSSSQALSESFRLCSLFHYSKVDFYFLLCCSWIQECQVLLSERGYESASKVWSGTDMLGIFYGLGITADTFRILKVPKVTSFLAIWFEAFCPRHWCSSTIFFVTAKFCSSFGKGGACGLG